MDDPSLWKSASDPKTGRTYYYHRKTRESTWSKPECLIKAEDLNEKKSSSPASQPSITNDTKERTKSPLQQLQEQTQAMFKKQFIDDIQSGNNNDHDDDDDDDDEDDDNDDVIENNFESNDDDNYYDDIQDNHHVINVKGDTNIDKNNDFSSLIADLTSKAIDTRENAVRLLLSYCIPSMMSTLSQEPELMTNLVSVIMQCQKGLEQKRDSYIRRTALRCLWSLSTDASIAAKTFHTNQSWTILCEFVPSWDDLESGLIFVSMMSLLLSSVQFVLSDDVMKDLCVWMDSKFFESSKPKNINLDVLIAHPSPEGLSIIDGRFLQYFSINAHHGQGLPGLVLLALMTLGFQSENHAVWLIRNGGLDALQHLCISPKVNNSIRSQGRKVLLGAMSSSSFVRERILDMSIHLSSSFAHVPYPQGPDPLSISCLSNSKKTEAFTQEWIPDQEVDGLKRDVELRPKSGGVGWFLCSSILWVRCPALRESLENYWNDEANDVENNDPLLISVNASVDVLASLCKYLHTGIFLPPHDPNKKLELYAVASQLEMPHLASVVSDAIINCLSEDIVDDTIEFCKDYNLNELERSCRTFKVAGHKPTIHFNTGATDSSPGGSALKQAIMASLNDVTELLYKTSPAPATSIAKIRTPVKDDTSLIYEDEAEYETSDSEAYYGSDNLSAANQVKSKKSAKSGGIYSLLLQSSADVGTGPVQIGGNTPPGKAKKVMPPSKSKSVKPAASKAPGKVPPNKSDATPKTKRAMALLASSRSSNVDFDEFGEPVEFDKRMSMLPEPALSEKEKRLQHISRPRTGGISKEKVVEEEPTFEEIDEIEESPITVKPSSSPPRESFSSKSVQSVHSVQSAVDQSTPQRLQNSVRGSLTLLKTKTRRRRSIAEVDQTEPEIIDDYSSEQADTTISSRTKEQIPIKVVSNRNEPLESKRRNSNCIRKAGCQCSNCLALASVSLQQPISSISYSDNIDEDTSNTAALHECGDCGRKFNANAYEKHVKICKKVFINSRKQFDMTKQRIQDDEQLRILQDTKKKKDAKNNASEKSTKWKNQSQAFREAMKAARDVSHAISTGAPLPPPTISAPDPSLIPCPHCGRRFNEKAAERHIPLCTSIKAKPTKLNKGGGISASAGVSLKDKKKHSTW